jgi:hypothetical protein
MSLYRDCFGKLNVCGPNKEQYKTGFQNVSTLVVKCWTYPGTAYVKCYPMNTSRIMDKCWIVNTSRSNKYPSVLQTELEVTMTILHAVTQLDASSRNVCGLYSGETPFKPRPVYQLFWRREVLGIKIVLGHLVHHKCHTDWSGTEARVPNHDMTYRLVCTSPLL